jgi:hypothetical protein
MGRNLTVGIVSDIHYASPAEQARGNDYDWRELTNPLLRMLVRIHRRHFWLREPLNQNHLLDQFLEKAASFDYLVANGDYSCNTASLGLSDEAAFQSTQECLHKLRQKFGPNLRVTLGDHELGKISFFGGRGGMRLASWRRAQEDLGLQPFWQLELGNWVLIGLASSLVALPVFAPDTLPAELAHWERLRAEHLAQIRRAFEALTQEKRVLLFCHDPTALPFLWAEEVIRSRLLQIEQTIIGHLHSRLILWKSRVLAGIPRIGFLGHTAKRLSTALHQGRRWRPFRVRLCPSLAGIELLKDGGYLTVELDSEGTQPAKFRFHRLPR